MFLPSPSKGEDGMPGTQQSPPSRRHQRETALSAKGVQCLTQQLLEIAESHWCVHRRRLRSDLLTAHRLVLKSSWG